MVAIVTGNGVGLGKSSAELLGQSGHLGLGQLPGAAGKAYVNAATGNLIIQRNDELLLGRGPDIAVYQTYNSQGTLDFDNNDNWQVSLYRQLSGLTGTVNSAGSTIARTAADGSQLVYTYDSTAGSATLGKYINKDGSGSYDTLSYTSSSNTWVWQDGDTRIKESYTVDPNDSAKWRITRVTDLDNNSLAYTYSTTSGLTGLIDTVTSANGEITQLIYNSSKQLMQINVMNSSGVTTTRIRYTYESTAPTARLLSVSTDLTPADNSIADGKTYTTSYTYDGSSKRIASITNSDGSKVSFSYEQSGSFRLLTISDYVANSSTINNTTTLNYTSASTTTVTNTNDAGTSLVTTLTYDSNGQLTNIQGPFGSGQNVSYTYNTNGDVTQVTDSRGNWTKYTYDAQGNQLTQQDNLGNTIVRTYDSTATGCNQLLTQTAFTGADANPGDATVTGIGTAQTTRYTYDSNNHLRFTISPEGRVTEYRYSATSGQLTSGQLASTHQYTDNLFTTTGNQTEAQMNAWLTAAIKSKSQRTDYLYGARGQLSETVVYTKVNTTAGSEGNGIADGTQMRTQYVYDHSGNLKQKIDARGVATGTANDYMTSYSYDGLNRLTLTKQYDATGQEAKAVLTVTTYSETNRQVTLTLASGLVTTSTYDLAGRLLSVQKSDSSNTTAGSLGTTSYAYDKLGNLRMVTDPAGQNTYYLYDSANRKVGEIDANKNLTEWVYNSNGQVIRTIQYKNPVTATLSAVAALTNTLATAGVRPAADTTNDRSSHRVYDQAGRLSHEIDALGYVTQYQYDAASRLLKTLKYSTAISAVNLSLIQSSTTDVYGSYGSIKCNSGIAITNTLTLTADATNDRANRHLYDNDGKLIGTLDGEGYLTEYVYDQAGRKTQTIRYATVTSSANWAAGNLATSRSNATAVATDSAKHQTTNYIYDAAGQLTGVVDAENYLTEYQYDLVGNKTLEIRYATSITYVVGNTIDQSRPASNNQDQTTTNTYDASNRMLSTLSNTPGQVNGLLTNYTYDSVGNLTQTVKTFTGASSAQERVQRRQYDSRGNLIATLSGEGVVALLTLGTAPTQQQIENVWNTYGTRYHYDTAGRLISKLESNGRDVGGNKTLYYYNAEGKLTYTINALGEVSQTVYNSFDQVAETRRYHSRIAYDTRAGLYGGADSAVTSVISDITVGGYSSVQSAYDQAGLLISTTDELTNTNSRTYNAFGELKDSTDKIDSSSNLITNYQYDRKGLLKMTTENSAGINRITSAIYDAFGRVTQATNGRNNVTTFSYDRLDRTVTTTDALSQGSTVTYDAFDRKVSVRDARGNTTSWSYNATNRTMTMTTAENISVVTTVNTFGEVVKVMDGRGSETTYTYNADGQLTSTVEDRGDGKLNITNSTAYDKAGRVYQTTDARGTVTEYNYDPINRVVHKSVDPTGIKLATNYSYDALGRQIWAQDAQGVWTRMDYDQKGQLTKVVIDPANVPITDPHWVVWQMTANAAALNLTTSYTYDARGKKLTVIKGDGTASARTTQYVYDKLGRLTSSVVDPGINKLNLTTRYTYDKNDNVVLKTDANGNQTVYSYDAKNRLVYTVDALGYVTKKDYDANGNIVKVRAYLTPLATGVLSTLQGAPAGATITPVALGTDRITRYAYDKDNRLTDVTDSEWFVTRNEYDANGNVVKHTRYATRATAVSETGGMPAVAINVNDRIEQTVYDAANRATHKADALNYLTINVYDANGNVVKATRYANPMVGTMTTNTAPQIIYNEGSGNNLNAGSGNYLITSVKDQTTLYSYDRANRRTFTMQANGSVAQYHYDKLGQTIKVTRYANAMVGLPGVGSEPYILLSQINWGGSVLQDTSIDRVVEQKFDAAGRKTEAIDANGKSIKTEYNATGDIVKVTDALGNAGYFYTDAAGRVTLQVDPEGAVTQTLYDGLGNVTTVLRFANKVQASGTGVLSTSASIQIVSTAPGGNSVYVLIDAAKDQKQTSDYDQLGQKRIVKTWIGLTSGSATTDYYTEGYTYNAFGDVETHTARNGLVTTYTYDKQSHKVSESFAGITVRNAANNGTITLKNSYAYNGFGDLVTKVEADGAHTTRTTTYDYDKLSRQQQTSQLVQTTAGVSASAITQKTYDARGNLVAERDANGNWAYTYYDKQDRRTASVKADGSYVSWTYDALGNVSEQKQYANKVQLLGSATLSAASYIYDKMVVLNGDAVYVFENAANDRTTLYTYDKVGRQTATEIQNITTGVYHAASSQYQVSTGSLTTRAEYDALGNIVKQTDAYGNETRSWYNKAGQLIAKLDAENYLTVWTRDVYGNISQETRYANKVQTIGTATYTDSGVPEILTTTPTGNRGYVLADSTNDRTTIISYDKLNRVSRETVNNVQAGSVIASNGTLTTAAPTNATTSYQYDGLNNIIQKTDATSAVTNWVYDGLGRKLSEINPQFTDFEGNAVRTRTDKEYDGLNNVTREIRRGRDDSVETDDQITTYRYGVGGRLISEKDATNAEIQYEYDLNGNITKKTLKDRKKADQAINNQAGADDVTTYSYDSLNHQIMTTDMATSVVKEVQYNSFNQIAQKRTYISSVTRTTWDEYTLYDQAGRVWKSNSGNGVTKVYVSDKNGNTTVSISGTLDMTNMSLAQVLAQKQTDTKNNTQQQTLYTFSAYDKRNQLLTTVQPDMDGAHQNVSVVQITDANQSLVVTSGSNSHISGSSGKAQANPVEAGNVGLHGGNVQWSYTVNSAPKFRIDMCLWLTLPTTLGLGEGNVRVELQGIAAYPGATNWNHTLSLTAAQANSPINVMAYGFSTKYRVTVFKTTLLGDVRLYELNYDILTIQKGVAPVPLNITGLTDTYAKKMYIKNQLTSTSKLLLNYRPAGSNAAYTTVSVPQMVNTAGAAMAGMYAFDWSALAIGNYEFQYVALDSSDRILNQQSGTFNTTNATAPTVSAQTPLAIGGLGRAFFSSTSVAGMSSGLQLINQGADAASVVMRYRIKGSSGSWISPTTSFVSNPGFGTGSFVLDPAGLSSMTNGNEYDVEFDVKNSSGTTLRTVSGTIKKDSAGFSVVGNLQAASKLIFTQPATASTLYIRFRTLGSTGAYSSFIRLNTTGNGRFEWDPTSLIPNLANTYDYDFDIEARNADGILVNHNQVNLRLGASTSQLASQNIALPQVLRIKSSQTGISYLRLSYRVKGSNSDYTALDANITASTNADASTEYRFELPSGLAAGDYEYTYAYAADTVDANGDTLRTPLSSANGYFTAGVAGTASRLDWVIQSTSNITDNAIKRSQSYNAFGQVDTETDGRGNVTSYTYNTMGAMTKKVAPAVNITKENGEVTTATPTTEYTYDTVGRVIAVKDANGNLNMQVWLAGSNADASITLEKHADGGIKTAGFDIFGNKRSEFDELGHRTDYTYDKENRLTRIDRQARSEGVRSYDEYTYDVSGNRTSHTTSANVTNTYQSNATRQTEKTDYDSLGRVTKTTSFMGFNTTYAYNYVNNNIGGIGGSIVSGWQKITTRSDGRTLKDNTDMFNRVVWHEDMSGRQFTYAYNQAGWLTSQTSLGAGTQYSGQNIVQSYYNNGNIKAIHDKAVGMYTYYEYDKDGNRTFEGYISFKDAGNFAAGAKDYYQYATIEYDAMNRMTSVLDPKASIQYEYDAVGNRRMVKSTYHDGVNGSLKVQEYWYKYDSMNRFLVTMGSLSGARGAAGTSVTKGAAGGAGVEVSYNLAGQRIQVINAADSSTETYSYTNDGYLTNVSINGVLRSTRYNDALGRVITYTENNSSGSQTYAKTTTYDKDNRVNSESSYVDGSTSYTYAANGGELAQTTNTNGGTTVNTYYAYEYWDEAKQSAITNQGYNPALKKNNAAWKPGYSELQYDVNGHLKGAVDRSGNRSFRYVNDAQGLILFRDEIAGGTVNRVHRYYYVDGKRVGDVGNEGPSRTDYVQAMANRGTSKSDYKNFRPIASADFDQNYEPISPSYPGATATNYTVKSGDTLQSIARTVWGDADMWYLIADANGLTSGTTLTSGQVLTIPNKVTNIHNNSGTYRVYNPGEAIGDINPTLPTAPPPPKKKNKCGGFGPLIVAVVTVVAAIVAPQLIPAIQSMTPTLGAMATAAFANVAGQVAGNLVGVQKGFDFKSFGTAVASAGITQGVSGITNDLQSFASKLGGAVGGGYAAIAARAVVGNVIGQGIGNITGAQKGFNWSSVAISGIGTAAGAAISDHFELSNHKDGLGTIGTKFGDDLGRAAIDAGAFALTQLVVRGGKVNWQQVATGTVINLIQNRTNSAVQEAINKDWGWFNRLSEAQKNALLRNNFVDNSNMNDISEADQKRINDDRETLKKVFGENSTATPSEIENGKSLLHSYGYRVGALESELTGMKLTVDQKVSLLRGDGDSAMKYAQSSAVSFLNNDDEQLNNRFSIFSDDNGGEIARMGEDGSMRKIKFEFSSDSARLAGAIGVSFKEARAKTSWEAYESVINAAFNTKGLKSLQFDGLWRPTVSFFKEYFAHSQDAKFDGKTAKDRTRMALEAVRNAHVRIDGKSYKWSDQHTKGNAIDISVANGRLINNGGWENELPKIAAPEIVDLFIDSLSAQQPRSLLTPWRIYSSKGSEVDVNGNHYNINTGITSTPEKNHWNHIHFGI
jgi:YD repeat-containing protein